MISTGWLMAGVLVGTRLGAVAMVMPVLGANGVPMLIRLLFTMSITAVVAPIVPPVVIPVTLGALFFAMLGEMVLGVLVGGIIRLVFGTLHMAGAAISMQIGHAAASMFDPQLLAAAGPLTRMASLLGTVVFLGADLHLHLFVALADSFVLVPPGMASQPLAAAGLWPQITGMVLETGTRIAAPTMALVFLVNLFVAVLTRLAPSMNVFFSLGLILTVTAGHVLFYLALPNMLDMALSLLRDTIDLLPLVWRMVGT